MSLNYGDTINEDGGHHVLRTGLVMCYALRGRGHAIFNPFTNKHLCPLCQRQVFTFA